jgi:hypothetical protein
VKVTYLNKCSGCLPPNAMEYDQVYVFHGDAVDGIQIFLTILVFVFLLLLNNHILLFFNVVEDELVFTIFRHRIFAISSNIMLFA